MSPSVWAKPSTGVRPLQPMCRMSGCEHRACRALSLSWEGPSCSANPSWCEGMLLRAQPAAWGRLQRARPGQESSWVSPGCLHPSLDPTPVLLAGSCTLGCAHVAMAAAPALCLAAGRDCRAPWLLVGRLSSRPGPASSHGVSQLNQFLGRVQ